MCYSKSPNKEQKIELADVFNQYASQYCQHRRLPLQQLKVVRAIRQCRTDQMGGNMQECNQCGSSVPHYNSCRNRHCPKCQSLAKLKWLAARQQELLPVEYFHVVFTLPHELNELAMYNQDLIYKFIFQAAWHAISSLGYDPKRLGGEMGMLSILHTWGQNMTQHIHVHCVIPGGALQTDKITWKSCKPGFLFPVKALSRVYRGKYISLLREAYNNSCLEFGPTSKYSGDSAKFSQLLSDLMKKNWVVYSKKPFGGPEAVLNYLGRYTHRIAISNDRILSCDNNKVRFRWRDYAHGSKLKTMELSSDEFIRRFLLHTLPKRFTRIRSFGFLANACKRKKIKLIKNTIDDQSTTGVAEASEPLNHKIPVTQMMKILTGVDIDQCPFCKKGMLVISRPICPNNRAPPKHIIKI